MKNNTKRLLTGVTAAVMSLSAISAADVAVMGSAISAFAADGVAVNDTNFPDENFRNYVSENIDLDGNGVLSDSEIKAVSSIDVEEKMIADLKGVEFFTSLTELNCVANQLTSLDVSKNTALRELYCYSNSFDIKTASLNELTNYGFDGAINYRVFNYIPGQKIRQFGSDTKGTSMTVKGLKGGEKTGIIVLAQFANKKWSTYTEDDIVYVTPLDAVKPYLCVNPKADGKVYLIWSSVPTSVRYKVMAREVGTKDWKLIGATRQRCRITVDGFNPNKQYEFLVRGLNAKGKYTPMAADDIVVGTSLS